MVYNKATNLVIRIGVAIGPVGLTRNLGRLKEFDEKHQSNGRI